MRIEDVTVSVSVVHVTGDREALPSTLVTMRRWSVLSIIFLFGFLGTVGAQSQKKDMDYVLNKPVQHKYKTFDNIFFGGSAGVNYSLSENVDHEGFFKMLRPQIDFTFGKFFNKWFAARIGIGFLSQEASVPQEVQELFSNSGENYGPYNLCMLGSKLDAMFSLNRLFSPYRFDEPFQLWAFGGLDGSRSMGFQHKVKQWTTYPVDYDGKWLGGWHFGLEAQFRTGDHYSFTVSTAWHQASSSYHGQVSDTGNSRNYLTLNIGFVYRFTNSHGEMGFHNCSHHENYYFDEMNRRIERYYQKNDISAPGQQDSVICFPIHYSYLTPIQKTKLDRLAERLSQHAGSRAIIDVYSDGDESPVYNEFRTENREENILKYMAKAHPGLSERITIRKHPEGSPIPPVHMWSRAGIITIEKPI